jgi:hypothetical protein
MAEVSADSWRLILPDDDGAPAIAVLVGCWISEYGGHPYPWDEAWICGEDDGFATFLRSRRWTLSHVWVRPSRRRQGRLAAAWPLFRERYGPAFEVSQPSPEMRAFLARRAAD